MAEHEVVTTDAEIEAALKSAKLHDSDPVAQTVEHVPELNLLIVGLSNRRRLVLPVEEVQGLGKYRITSCLAVEPASVFRRSMSTFTSLP